MIKLAKYLKPFTFGLILSVALLFLQAVCDLNLPDYMSEIVDVGIQQGGIEHAAPRALSTDGMRLITAFMTDNEKRLVSENYTPVSVSGKSPEGKTYGELYSGAVDTLYIKNDADAETDMELDAIFGAAAVTFINIASNMERQSDTVPQSDTDDKTAGIDLSLLYQMQPVFDTLTETSVIAAREESAESIDITANQSGIMLTGLFYDELGINLSSGYIFNTGLKMLLVALLSGAATVMVSFISTKIATGVVRNLRYDVFDKVERFSNNEFDKFSTASLITRCTNDVTQMQMLLMMGIRMMCYAPIMGVGGTIMALRKSVSMSWIIAAAVIILMGIIMIVASVAMPKFKIVQTLTDRLNLVARENLSGLMVVRAFSTQQHEKIRFDKANKDLTDVNLFINRIMVLMMPLMMFIMNAVMLLIIWVGAHNIADSSMQIGNMMAFMQYAMQIIMSFLMISIMFIMVPRAAVSAERIAEVLTTDISIKDPENPRNFDGSEKGVVEFKNVCFRYHGAEEDALSEITFTAKPGETTAIIGSTGSGKSTVANLILRFYDVTQGQILVGGIDIREVRQKDLREKIGYVPQKGNLLSGTIASNLKYGRKEASDAEIETAAAVAQAADFIAEKPDGLESEIAQGGVNVSGGQKQRLSIARALAKNPEILIFDDSFSALDFKTDSALRKALKTHVSDATLIVVAQRVGTIINADRIIVLEKGKIVGNGKHKELLASCPEYFEIASSQLSREEENLHESK